MLSYKKIKKSKNMEYKNAKLALPMEQFIPM